MLFYPLPEERLQPKRVRITVGLSAAGPAKEMTRSTSTWPV